MRSPNALFLLFALPLASVRGQPVPAPSGWTATRAGASCQVTTTTTSRDRGNANLGGTYKVSGYTLELDGDGGAVQRVLAFYPFADNKSVYIDGVTYGLVDSK